MHSAIFDPIITPQSFLFQMSDRNNPPQITSTPEILAANSDEHLSQSLINALKKPKELGLTLANGFLNLAAILQHPSLAAKNYTFEDVERVISNRTDGNFERFELLKVDDQTWNIGLVVRPAPMHTVLFETLVQARKLDLVIHEMTCIDCNDFLQIPAIKEAQIKLEDIERLLSKTGKPHIGKYSFVRYESGLCHIRSNAFFTPSEREAKVGPADQRHSKQDLDICTSMGDLLRHKTGWARMSDDGFVDLDLLLKQLPMKTYHSNVDDIKRILSMEAYTRYVLIEYEPGRFKIKATHGHTIPKIMAWNWANWQLETKLQILAHGCTFPTWNRLNKKGFQNIGRVVFYSIASNDEVMKLEKEIEIWIDAVAAREDGVKFFVVPENKLIVTEGHMGRLARKYFIKVVDRVSGEVIKVSHQDFICMCFIHWWPVSLTHSLLH
jgi:RNA:NAD 2'-phosphotransferase (TPT1/KptA family)